MKLSYDYHDLIREIQKELEDGALEKVGNVQILRSEKALYGTDYHPIIDWYYDVETMRDLVAPDVFEDEEDTQDRKSLVKDYFRDFPRLQTISVFDMLKEMIDWDRII